MLYLHKFIQDMWLLFTFEQSNEIVTSYVPFYSKWEESSLGVTRYDIFGQNWPSISIRAIRCHDDLVVQV